MWCSTCSLRPVKQQMSNMITYFYGTELNCSQHTMNIHTFSGEYFLRQSRTTLYRCSCLYYIFFILSIHAFDSKFQCSILLYIFLLTVFIVMHQNTNGEMVKKLLDKKCDSYLGTFASKLNAWTIYCTNTNSWRWHFSEKSTSNVLL